ncbi:MULTISPECIES: SpoIIE family protein phosphatase [Sorangium]|uniref:Phosphoserine phosphatase n=1 Tax=Sorangium cellulosum TaxID=56 RepID=A0A4P2QWJ3_SORCE|nr:MULTISPECIES: SpoIIE family protein phosphatase [Sorangium]AUX34588.1 phosphoserine phosphatase [Sorangium cellulosum]WCQ93900.1 DNA binding protein [Sorangium sp. Soce836]
MSKKRRTIALLMDYVRGEYQSEVRFGVERAAEAHDVNLVIAFGETLALPGSSGASQNSIYHLIGPETVDGVIVASTTLCHHVGVDGMQRFCRSYAPLPVCSIGVAIDGVPSLVVDNALGIEMAVGHMVERHGLRRVAYIAGPASNEEADVRSGAYWRALAARSLPADERLFACGMFSIDSGRAAMREILDRGVELDAVIVANDAMALGAIDALRARGLGVPEDVLVCGFDDAVIARFTKPSMSTIRQPIKRLGARAVDTLMRMIDGEPVPGCDLFPVELTLRESCGCGNPVDAAGAPLSRASGAAPPPAGERDELSRALEKSVAIPAGSLHGWAGELLSALDDEIAGQEGRFLRALEALLDAAGREGANLEHFQGVVTLLRERFSRRPDYRPDAAQEETLEQIWHAARVLVAGASVRSEGQQRLSVELASLYLSWSSRSFSTCLSLPVLRRMMASELPRMQFSRVAVSLYDDPHRATMVPLFLMKDGLEVEPPPASFPARRLAPDGFLGDGERRSVIALSVAFGDTEKFGVAVLNSGANELVYDALRLQIGSAVKAAALHWEVVRQVELRERLEQEKVRQESAVAARIQTTLVPAQLAIEGLELAAVMKPAATVGGDYYDVIATPEGGWLGIGDVAGHGLAAGLVMLMIQSMISALTRTDPNASPSDILSAVNAAVYENVRSRLKRDEHATLLLLRYERSGRVTFAGAHDDIIVYRARTRRCVCIQSSGVWIGALPAIDAMTRDAEFSLEDGDILVLYSDGVTEARNCHREQFGLERLCSTIESSQHAPSDVIRDRILREVEGWCPSPDDDITVVVARYSAPRALSLQSAGFPT